MTITDTARLSWNFWVETFELKVLFSVFFKISFAIGKQRVRDYSALEK